MTIEELYTQLNINRPACTTVTITNRHKQTNTLPLTDYIDRLSGLGFDYDEICEMMKSLMRRELLLLTATESPDIENLIDKIESILIAEGQHDLQFKLGEIIKYDPHAVKLLLLKHTEELKNSL